MNGGRIVQHLDRRTGRASRSGSHQSKKKQLGARSFGAERPLGFSGKETAGSVPDSYHSSTRTVQESWKGAIDSRASKIAQEKGEPTGQETVSVQKQPPCWVVATKALEAAATMDSLMIQLSKEGEI
eukprot:1804295-Prymnesium_polylepis.1